MRVCLQFVLLIVKFISLVGFFFIFSINIQSCEASCKNLDFRLPLIFLWWIWLPQAGLLPHRQKAELWLLRQSKASPVCPSPHFCPFLPSSWHRGLSVFCCLHVAHVTHFVNSLAPALGTGESLQPLHWRGLRDGKTSGMNHRLERVGGRAD